VRLDGRAGLRVLDDRLEQRRPIRGIYFDMGLVYSAVWYKASLVMII
jgi:hypothetical protein